MNTRSRKILTFIVFAAVILILFSGCANKEDIEPCLKGHKFNFLWGVWHGFIAPFNFIGMFFRTDVTLYAQNNTGIWYALGFLIGSGGWGFFGGRGACRGRRRKKE